MTKITNSLVLTHIEQTLINNLSELAEVSLKIPLNPEITLTSLDVQIKDKEINCEVREK